MNLIVVLIDFEDTNDMLSFLFCDINYLLVTLRKWITIKQIIQDLKNGTTILEDVPTPIVRSGCVLIQTTRTLVSLGTERMLVDIFIA